MADSRLGEDDLNVGYYFTKRGWTSV